MGVLFNIYKADDAAENGGGIIGLTLCNLIQQV